MSFHRRADRFSSRGISLNLEVGFLQDKKGIECLFFPNPYSFFEETSLNDNIQVKNRSVVIQTGDQ